MGFIDNLRKTSDYVKRNGVKKTLYAVSERLGTKKDYKKRVISNEVLETQRRRRFEDPLVFDIIVPAYNTDPSHFRAMVDSVLGQTYDHWHLYIGDAGDGEELGQIIASYDDHRLIYSRLHQNGGISDNTNAILDQARGDYVVLLDHDDYLDPDAIYLLMEAADGYRRKKESLPAAIYTDEDKCNGEGTGFYEVNRKPDFDRELLLTNNYICHLLCVRGDLTRKARFRKEYDGAQDHDLILRVSDMAGADEILHVPVVTYHWRCHENSTSSNPASKRYAYEAGRRAVESYIRSKGWKARVVHTEHLGFFRVEYDGDIFDIRRDVGALCGPVIKGGRIVSGACDSNGNVLYQGLSVHYSGYMNRAHCVQSVYSADTRNMRIRPELTDLCTGMDDPVEIAEAIREKGYTIIYDPMFRVSGDK